ncbi:MAG: phenylalanine--tRNA ligase subunit beta [bacterium]
MKLSRKFVEEYVKIPKIKINEIADDMTSVGNEYDYAGKLVDVTNIVIGKVISCEKHPDSDKLKVCKVDVKDEVLDIVCGAPNCREGLKVIVAKVGAMLPEIEIKESTIRGQKSCGMLCALSELGIENKYVKNAYPDGIYELEEDAIVGEDPLEYLGFNDEVIDFELTSNRGDLLSILGMSYELGAIYKEKVKDIDLSYEKTPSTFKKDFKLTVNTDDCSLFLVKKATDIEVKESPKFIKERLISSGIRPINNVVDISNYVMLETGQPLHFYDADNLGNEILVRNAKEEEKLTTLDEKERVLSVEDIVITNGKEAIGLAGVMGGYSTEVNDDTKNIVIESAIFDSVKIRKTSKKILRSEASNRFEKGIDPKRTYMAMERSCHLLEKYASAKIVEELVEYNNNKVVEQVIEVTYEKIKKVLGMDIQKEEIIEILNSLAFSVKGEDSKVIVTIPTRRPDIKIQEDVIEEIGRIYGIDNIVGILPTLSASVGKYNKNKREIKNKMISFGLNESLSYTLVPEDSVKKFTKDEFEHVKLADPMSLERNTLRYSLIYSLFEVYNHNKARSMKDVSLFELGKGFYKKEAYGETLKLACLMSGNYYLDINKTKVDFYIIKGIVEELMDYLGYAGRYSFVIDENIPNELHPKQSASIIMQGKPIGIIGKLHPKETKEDVFVFEINLDKLLENKASKMSYKEISKYPSIKKDIAFIMEKNMQSGEVEQVIKKAGGKILTNVEVFDYYVGDSIKENEKSIAYSLTFASKDKTLTEEEVMEVFNKIIETVTTKCGVILRDK